jgi:hypothetical protein
MAATIISLSVKEQYRGSLRGFCDAFQFIGELK